jgi:hypothetical protein
MGAAVLAIALCAQDARGGEAAGSTTVTYTARSAPGIAAGPTYRDQDMEFWARAQGSSLMNGKADGRMTVRAFKDIDGGPAPGDPLYQVGDSYSSRGAVQLYEGYLSFRKPAGLPATIALGRQYVPVGGGPASSFDGLSAQGKYFDNTVRVVVFGGERVSHYRTPDTKAILGGSVSVAPWDGGLFAMSDLKYTRHSWDASLSQRFAGDQLASGRVAFVDGDPESIRLATDLKLPAGFGVTADYLRTLGKKDGGKQFPFDFTSLDDGASSRLLLGLPAPYARYHLEVRKRLGRGIILSMGGVRRKLVHSEDEDENNRSDWEAEGAMEAHDFPVSGIAAYVRMRHVWEDRKKSQNGSSQVATAGISYAATKALSLGGELFGNGEKRVVSEPLLLTEGASTIHRNERGKAVWAQWSGKHAQVNARYEHTRDDLYAFYGAKNIQTVSLTASAAIGEGAPRWAR